MNAGLPYLLLLKGTITAFVSLVSLPVIQESPVNHYHALTNQQLNEAEVITRSSPGRVGLYIVSVGCFAAGLQEPLPAARHDHPVLIIPRSDGTGHLVERGGLLLATPKDHGFGRASSFAAVG
jgi:hypothetical protein